MLWIGVQHVLLNTKAFTNKSPSCLSHPQNKGDEVWNGMCQCQKNPGQQNRNLAPSRSRRGSDLVFIWLVHVLVLGDFDEAGAKKARGCFSFLLLQANKGLSFTWCKGYTLVFGNNSVRRSCFLLPPSLL